MTWTMKVRSIHDVPNTMGRYVEFAPTEGDTIALRCAQNWDQAQIIMDRYKPADCVALSYSENRE